MPALVTQQGRPLLFGSSDIRRQALQDNRAQMNQGGIFDRVGNRSRYDQSQQRQDEVLQQLNDQAMRERMQGRDLSTQVAMQGNEINSRYGLAAQESKARERLAAQEFGHSMARLNAEFGFKSGEGNKERTHVKDMAGFEAQLKEIANSKDFQRDLSLLAVKFGMSEEQARNAFDRLLTQKGVENQYLQDNESQKHGFGLETLGAEHANDTDMERVRSRYDMLANDQKFGQESQLASQQFGFDKEKTQMDRDLALRNQDSYWDRYSTENRGLNEQKFTQEQKAAQANIDRQFDSQFDMALAETRGMKGNLTEAGDVLLNTIEEKVAEMQSSVQKGDMDAQWRRQAQQEIMGLIGQARQPNLLKPNTFQRGDKTFTTDNKNNWIELNPNANQVKELPNGLVIVYDNDGRPLPATPPRQSSSSGGQDYDAFIEQARATLKRTHPVTNEELPYDEEKVRALAQKFRADAMGQGEPPVIDPRYGNSGPPDNLRANQMMDEMNRGNRMFQGRQSGPPAAMMQRGPTGGGPQQAPQPPRPQNTMQGQQAAPQIAPIEQQRLQAAGFDGRQLVMARQILESNKDILSQVSSVEELPEQLRLQISHALQIHNIASGR
jgi:hypothetical protein